MPRYTRLTLNQSSSPNTTPNPVRLILVGSGIFFVVCAILYNPLTVNAAVKLARMIAHRPGIQIPIATYVLRMQAIYLVIGVALFALGQMVDRIATLRSIVTRTWAQKLILALIAFILPLATLEVALRPFAPKLSKSTSLFMKDDDLGWRMRPGAREEWGDVTVQINGKGLRGTELPYEKPDDTYRILYLGDSVTFGFGIADHKATFPYLIADHLGRDSEFGKMTVETINAGCGGYSPWQELIFLSREGYQYDPDLVLVGFVLNDVTEKFHLVKFGGQDEGYQLTNSYYSWFDKLLSRSGLAYQVRNITREIKAKQKLGDDLQLGAVKQEILDVETLMKDPDREHVNVAWNITLMNLLDLVTYCREREIGVGLVTFPFAVQLHAPAELSAPQTRIQEWAADHRVAMLDLLPVLSGHTGIAPDSASALFIDHDHLSLRGHEIAANAIAEFVREKFGSRSR